jgi:hypothetical protein
MKERQEKPKKLKVTLTIEVRSRKCPVCGGVSLVRHYSKTRSKIAYDLRVSESGIRRQVILCTAALHYCTVCNRYFLPPRYRRSAKHYHSLMSWTMYQHVVHRVSFEMLDDMLRDYFCLPISHVEIHMFKPLLAHYYRKTYQQILSNLLAGDILHMDETTVNFRKSKGYVWVIANMENVIYVFRPTRDGDWLHELLCGFKGVLITDFYSAYDSIACEQQKCLVHLIRDMNDDLLRNPFDQAFRLLVSRFGALLRIIVSTIDEHGLRQRYLHKHEADVERFYRNLDDRAFASDLAGDYRGRLVRYREKLFTFLRHDGVPWNNNNAEHAIKPFARYRSIADGVMSETRLRDYLVLLSLFQTCKYRGISFLRFLLSRKKSLNDFHDSGRLEHVPIGLELYPRGLSNFPQQGRSKKAKAVMDRPFFPHG